MKVDETQHKLMINDQNEFEQLNESDQTIE